MREILFRGKITDHEREYNPNCTSFVEGFYKKTNTSFFISIPKKAFGRFNADRNDLEVEPETVGEYIGKKDRNGDKIYEGDIVSIVQEPDDEIFIVGYDVDSARFIMSTDTYVVDFDNYGSMDIEIIGNKFDNPELLEGRK